MRAKADLQLAKWLYCGACCIFIQILLGGITRLTGSGLSITEWQPLIGFLPPMDTAQWNHSFNQYKEIAQFKQVNSHFGLVDYQMIFFWEWLHRNWARMLGLIFIIPFFVFLFTGKIRMKMLIQLTILFLLGSLQAVIGWIMVKSGLNDTSIAVNDVKLAIHFITALLLLAYTLWLAFKLSIPPLTLHYASGLKKLTGFTLILIFLQLFYGGLMAGSKAALAAQTWPDINGHIIPPEFYVTSLRSGTTYLLTVQFIHRTLAYLIAILILLIYKKSIFLKAQQFTTLLRPIPLILVLTQIVLGIMTLLNTLGPFYKFYALIHQGTGILLMAAVLPIFYLSHKKSVCERSL